MFFKYFQSGLMMMTAFVAMAAMPVQASSLGWTSIAVGDYTALGASDIVMAKIRRGQAGNFNANITNPETATTVHNGNAGVISSGSEKTFSFSYSATTGLASIQVGTKAASVTTSTAGFDILGLQFTGTTASKIRIYDLTLNSDDVDAITWNAPGANTSVYYQMLSPTFRTDFVLSGKIKFEYAASAGELPRVEFRGATSDTLADAGAATPEPGTWALLLSGGALAAWMGRRRRNATA